MGSQVRPPRMRVFLPLFLAFGIVAGPLTYGVGQEVDAGYRELAAFGIVFVALTFVLAGLGNQLEAMVFSLGRPPWLSGRLGRGQRLLLPASTGSCFSRGFGVWTAGTGYLLVAPPGLDAFAVAAVAANFLGAAVLWLGVARLVSGIVVLRASGLWRAPRWTWVTGAALVVVLPTIFGARSLMAVAANSAVI
jgi:hypothetical protein